MFAKPSKSSLARVTSKAIVGSSHTRPKFSHGCSAEMDKPSSAPPTVVPISALPATFIDLEAMLENAPTFDECFDDLPFYSPRGASSKGKEKAPPSLLDDEDQVVAHLCLVLSDKDIESFKGNSMGALARSTSFDLGKVSALFHYFYSFSYYL